MKLFKWMDSKINRMNWLDIGMLKIACIVFGIFLAKLIPSLTKITFFWLMIIFIAAAILPMLKIYKK